MSRQASQNAVSGEGPCVLFEGASPVAIELVLRFYRSRFIHYSTLIQTYPRSVSRVIESQFPPSLYIKGF